MDPRPHQGLALGERAELAVIGVEHAARAVEEDRSVERARIAADPAPDLLQVGVLEVGHVEPLDPRNGLRGVMQDRAAAEVEAGLEALPDVARPRATNRNIMASSSGTLGCP